MKKFIAGLSALALAGMMTMTAFAEEPSNTIISPKGGIPFDKNPDPSQAETKVKFGVDPTYTVTIPAMVELEEGTGGTYSNSGELKAENVKLEEGSKIIVTLTSASQFNLKTSPTATYQLPYTAEGAFGALTDKVNGGKVAEFTTPAEPTTTPQTTNVTFTTDEAPKYAGTYTDPVVFTIEIEGAESTAKTLTIGDAMHSLTISYTEGQKWNEVDLPEGWGIIDDYIVNQFEFILLAYEINGEHVSSDSVIDDTEKYIIIDSM